MLLPFELLLVFELVLELELLPTGVLADEVFELEPPTTPDIGCVLLFCSVLDETGVVDSVVFDIIGIPNRLVS